MAEIVDKRDLSHPFLMKRKFDDFSREQGGGGAIELSLGLSLNGKFGVDPTRPENPPLVRSSSVSSFVFTADATEAELGRTCSMPPAWQRRKEAQSVRRLEAKRKRVEKMDGRMGEQHVSIGSQGSCSSSAGSGCELQYTIQVSNIPVEARSPGSDHCPRKKQKTRTVEGTKLDKRSMKSTNHNAKEEKMKNIMMDMPCVSTQGVGPSGKRIQGFLYRYRKGEEVRIVCVCHGSFLTPAEFVKHAGGDDVSHPLKHIVVNPSPLL